VIVENKRITFGAGAKPTSFLFGVQAPIFNGMGIHRQLGSRKLYETFSKSRRSLAIHLQRNRRDKKIDSTWGIFYFFQRSSLFRVFQHRSRSVALQTPTSLGASRAQAVPQQVSVRQL
jgi:hypothetical protein